MQQRKLGRGFRFRPTDEEIVGQFLYEKISGAMPSSSGESFVMECDLYGEDEPWHIWERFRDKDDFDEDLYFFTFLKKKSAGNNGYRINRSVGSSGGCWHGEDSGSMIKADDHIREDYSATKKRFSYTNKGSNQHKLWILHEYSLELGQNKSRDNNCVLCRLRKKGGSCAPAAAVDEIASRNHKRKPTDQIITANENQCKRSRRLQTDNTIDAEVYSRVVQELPQPGSLTVINIDDEDQCFSSDTILSRETEACLRIEQEARQTDCALEAAAVYGIFGEIGICIPDDELFEEGARLFEEIDGSGAPAAAVQIEAGHEECLKFDGTHHQVEVCSRVEQAAAEYGIFEEFGLCVDDEFLKGAARLFNEIDGSGAAVQTEASHEESLKFDSTRPQVEVCSGAEQAAAEYGIFEELGICVDDEFFEEAARLFDEIDGSGAPAAAVQIEASHKESDSAHHQVEVCSGVEQAPAEYGIFEELGIFVDDEFFEGAARLFDEIDGCGAPANAVPIEAGH